MIGRLFTTLEHRPGSTIAALALAFALAYTASLIFLPKASGRIVVGDALHYYVYLRSAVHDGDLEFSNDYRHLIVADKDPDWIENRTPRGYVRNVMSVGPAIIWAPLYLLVLAGASTAHLFGWSYPLDGYGRLFQASAAYSGILASGGGAYFTYRLCRSLYDARVALWATLGMWLGSHALYYSLVSPTYSHAPSMLAASLFFYYWAISLDQQTPRRYALVGLSLGLAAIVRWQDAVFAIVPIIDAFTHSTKETRPIAATLRNLSACIAGTLIGFAPQIAVWLLFYGSPLALPQGEQFMRWASPQVFEVLFSDLHGLFTWTPLIAAGVLGLVVLGRDRRLIAACMIAAFLLALYANSVVADWWAGEAFGSRRFVSCFPIFTLGLAALLARLRPRAIYAVVLTAVLLNGLLLLQYQLFMHGRPELGPYPSGLRGLVVERFLVPVRVMKYLLD